MNEPIVAISTCSEKDSGIGIIRISSGKNKLIIKKVMELFFKKKFIFPRLATYSKIFIKNREIDDGIIIFFPKNKSYTGEDMLEIQTHGSVFILKKIFRQLLKIGFKKAEKGEFTSRAIENKKMNFFDVERLYSLYTLKNKKEILKKKKKYKKKFFLFNKKIFKLKLLIENEINFHEKNEHFFLKVKKMSKEIIFEISSFLKRKFFPFKKKIRISIIGRENVGKSTLFNILTNKKRSITSKYPGTTTNYVKETIKIEGKKVEMYDTAGSNGKKKIFISIRKKNEEILKKSDIIIKINNKTSSKKTKRKNIIYVINKADKIYKKNVFKKKKIFISCKFMFGIGNLKKKISSIVKKKSKKGHSLINSEIKKIFGSLKKISSFIKKSSNFFSTEILYKKIDNLQRKIIDMYNFKNKKVSKEIFKNFCIGK
ncbi:tRNA modification GTPase [Candidatus Vidania fulgoroideae]|nr:tRNA modification GTPase [Candidatus Vidania fulgoroideae]